MTTLMSVTFGQRALSQIELVLTRTDTAYTVAVNDAEGLLHLTEFPFQGGLAEGNRLAEDIEAQGEREQAYTDASEWFDKVQDTIDAYVNRQGSSEIRTLISTLN